MFKEKIDAVESDELYDLLQVVGDLDSMQSNPLAFSLLHGNGSDDTVHYLMPKEKFHTLNFVAEENGDYRPAKSICRREVIRVLDAEGMLRVERKNARGTSFTDADVGYEYQPVQKLYPTMPGMSVKPTMGWKPIDLTTVNLEAYEIIRAAPKPSRNLFRQGILKHTLSTFEGGEIQFRQGRFTRPCLDELYDDGDCESGKDPILLRLCQLIRNTNVIADGEEYHVFCRTDAKKYLTDNRQGILDGKVRLVASVETHGPFTDLNIIHIKLYCKDVGDVRALIGDDLRVVELESLEDLTERHLLEYKQHPAVLQNIEAKKQKGFTEIRPRRVVWPLLIHVTDSGPSLLIRLSVSDIEKLPHTVKILQGVSK